MQLIEINEHEVNRVIHRHQEANLKVMAVCLNKKHEIRLKKSLKSACKTTHASAVRSIDSDHHAIVINCGSLSGSVKNELLRELGEEHKINIYWVKNAD